jgi:arsenate reductase
MNKKNVLILCTGNSCRSIIAEALINKKLGAHINCYSSGVKASGRVNPNAKKVLEENNAWDDRYHSKVIEDVLDISYDLVITVCDNANESCPIFPQNTKVIHVGFVDPDGSEYSEFIKTYDDISRILLPIVSQELLV